MARTRGIDAKKNFQSRFGESFLKSVPTVPGVYLVYNDADALIYIGKAKNLRRRLSQYKNAKRRKKHAKMRAIVADAHRLEYRTLPSDLEATIEETRLIQEHRPKWNVAGAFYFLYPLIGVRREEGVTHFCYTTQPEFFPQFSFHGAYRSRHLTIDAFFSLMELLGYVGHRVKGRSRQALTRRQSYIVSFRQLPESWTQDWAEFFRGRSQMASENLVLSLLENAGARKGASEIQEHLNHLKRFWRHEATRLHRAIERTAHATYPVSQRDRDILFIRSKDERARTRAISRPRTRSVPAV